MAMPKRRNGRRKITVAGIVYWWNPAKWEATDYIRILSDSGRGSTIYVNPLQIMTPKHIAACIKHAIDIGWGIDSCTDLWLGFDETDVNEKYFRIPPNATVFKNEDTGRWEPPRISND